jgi:hypothetical protein
VLKAERKLNDAKSSVNFNSKAIVDAQNELATSSAGLEALETLQDELFPEV